MRKKLRQLQYHPTNDYNNEVDNAEVDALKVCMIHKMMVQDLSVENSELKTELEKTGIENKDLSILSNVSNSNPFSLSTDCVDQKYGNQWNRTKFSTPENHVKLQIPVTSVPPRLNFEVFSPITGVSRVYTQPKVLSRHNFDGTSNSPTPNSSTTKNLLETKESLEKLLGKLAEEQRALNFELARIPSTGHRARTRMEAVEDKLHIVEQQMASTRHKMKQLGIF